MSRRCRLLLVVLLTGLGLPVLAQLPAQAVVGPPYATTTTLSITPAGGAHVGQEVTFHVQVTAEDGQIPAGTVVIQDGQSCGAGGLVTSQAVDSSDGKNELTETFNSARPDGQFNACFFADDEDAYQDSEAAYQDYPITPVPTTTTLSITPAGGAHVGQEVTFHVQVTAEDGQIPAGTVVIQDGQSCGAGGLVTSQAVDSSDGKNELTETFNSARPDGQFNACFFADDEDAYQDSEAAYQDYPITPVPTTTTLSITPAGGAHVGQEVTFHVQVTAEDGQIPAGTVVIQDGQSCGAGGLVTSQAVDSSDGKNELTETFNSARPDGQFNACFFADDEDAYQDSEAAYQDYPITPVPQPAAPTITRQPTGQTVVVGNQGVFTAAASGVPTPTVLWQRSTNGGGSWSNVSGATSPTLKVTTTAAMSGYLYRAVFTNNKGHATTQAAQLLVTQSIRYTAPAANTKVKRGSTLTVKLQLSDRTGAVLSDAAAKAVPTRVQLNSSTAYGLAIATCKYDASANVFSCPLKVPTGLSPDTYYLAGQTRLGPGPWVLARPAGSAKNPLPVSVT